MIIFKQMIFALISLGTITIINPYLILHGFNKYNYKIGIIHYIGWLPIIMGILLFIWSLWDFTFYGKGTPAIFEPSQNLMIKGIYKYMRNPIYCSYVLILFGESLIIGSLSILCLSIFTFFIYHWNVITIEEKKLEKQFGESYKQYCKNLPRWFPRI